MSKFLVSGEGKKANFNYRRGLSRLYVRVVFRNEAPVKDARERVLCLAFFSPGDGNRLSDAIERQLLFLLSVVQVLSSSFNGVKVCRGISG